MPAARAFCAILAIKCSTFFPTIIIISANSSTTTTIEGSSSRGTSSSSWNGSSKGLPATLASATFLLKAAKPLTPISDINLYLLSISATHHLKPLDASVISVITGVNRWGIPSYTDNSSILGSIIIRRTASGSDLNSRLSNIAFRPTDFPDPVVPATSKWGILARSTTTGFPAISWPKAIERGELEFRKVSEDKISVNWTIFLLELGISIPTTDFPGITSTTLTLVTARDLAISWAMFVILLAFVPGAGWISNLVTTGPGITETTFASTPNSCNLISSLSATSSNCSFVREEPSSSTLSRRSVEGISEFTFLSFGL